VKNLEEIKAALLYEIDHFKPPDHSKAIGLIGVPWSAQRYLDEVVKMRKCLIEPYWHLAFIGNTATAMGKEQAEQRTVAVLAKDMNYVLCFDPHLQTYALGWTNSEGQISTFSYGDAVGIFVSR